MDPHQAYCINFLAFTGRWARGPIAALVAWGLSVVALTLTVAVAWLLGARLAGGTGVDLDELAGIEVVVATVWTIVNYTRVFRFFLGATGISSHGLTAIGDPSGRAAYAIASLLGPAAGILLVVLLTQ